jgi:hypothetical protein
VRFADLENEMRSCYQSAGQDMLEHGEAVIREFAVLRAYLEGYAPLPDSWRLPSWLTEHAGQQLLSRLPDDEILALYHRYHDCGKPRCRTVDDEGRQHFPDHAKVSKDVWLEHGGDAAVAELIAMDMDAHCLKAEGVAEFARRPQAAALLLTALAEIHANSAMFGGIESTSFKIKLKHIERRGKSILQHIQKEQ